MYGKIWSFSGAASNLKRSFYSEKGYRSKPSRKRVTKDQIENFLNGVPLYRPSSNVRSAQYNQRRKEMRFVFNDGRKYTVGQVSRQLARSYAVAPRSGIWYWDHVRVRGSKYRHQLPVWQS